MAISLIAMQVANGALAAPDLELGRYLSAECMTCHRTAAGARTTDHPIPNIMGVASAAIARKLKAYRSKELPNPVMQNIAERLKDDEIEALAAYFATLKRR